MSAGIAVETARMKAAPEALPTPIRGLTHTNRLYRSEGSVQPILTPRDIERFWSHVSQSDSCWHWVGSRNPDGYGNFTIAGRTHRAHRVSLVAHGITLVEGLVVDHICRVRDCVRPEHLRQVTTRENVLAGVGATAINARKTHCKRGHEFTPENTYQGRRGRECHTCRAAKNRRIRLAKVPCPSCGHVLSPNDMATHRRRHHSKDAS